MSLTVAALQFCPSFLAPEENRTRIAAHLAQCDAELAVIPELAFTGYFFASREELGAHAEPLDGPSCTMLRDIATSRGIAIVAGVAERDGARYCNSAVTVLPDGSLTVYRKTHLFGLEKTMFEPGDTGFVPLRWGGVVLGVMICYDWRFPESVRTLALRGAQVICHPSDLVAPPEMWKPVMRTRSLENKVFTITANRTGTEARGDDALTFHGCSQITAQNGSVLAETDRSSEGWIRAEIDPSRTLDKSFSPHNDIFGDRRPEFYER